MNRFYNKKLIENAKKLRKTMTKEERHLWYDCLKLLPVTVHKQKVIQNYIVDFYIASAKVVIELDGTQHFEETGMKKDTQRDAALQALGIKVLRYSNGDIHYRFREVCDHIFNEVTARIRLLENEGQ